MPRDRVDIAECLHMLREAVENLRRIRKEFVNEPDLLALYEPSARFLVKRILEEMSEDFDFVFSSLAEADTDVWISIEGEGLTQGRAPIGLIGRFLQKLAVANQHAVSLIEEVQHTSGRFMRRIEDLAQFELTAVTPGSVRLGLRSLDLERFIDEQQMAQQKIAFDGEVAPGAEAYLASAIESARRSVAGIRLLARALLASDNADDLERLEHDVHGRRNLLKLFHYAQSLTPSPRSQVRSIAISGSAISIPESEPVVATAVTRAKIAETVTRLQEHHRFVEGIGFVRAIDLDRRRVIVRPFVSGEGHLDEMECWFPPGVSEGVIGVLLDQAVSISGILVLSSTDAPRYLEVDSFETVGPQQG